MDKIAQIDFGNLQDIAAPNFGSGTNLANFIFRSANTGSLVPYLFFGAGVLLLLYLIGGGLQFMLSGGDPKKVESAKGKITNAFLGFFIVLFAYLIVQAIALILGLGNVSQVFS